MKKIKIIQCYQGFKNKYLPYNVAYFFKYIYNPYIYVTFYKSGSSSKQKGVPR